MVGFNVDGVSYGPSGLGPDSSIAWNKNLDDLWNLIRFKTPMTVPYASGFLFYEFSF